MYRLDQKRLPILKPSRALRFKRRSRVSVIRIFLSTVIIAFVAYVIFASGMPARAIETTKASALVFEEARSKSSLSFKPTSPQSTDEDPCLSLLHSARLSQGATSQGFSDNGQTQSSYVTDKKAASMALGIFLGARIALGPKEVLHERGRVQIGPQFRAANDNGENYALSVAAYRSCKNDYVLGLRQHNYKKGVR